MSSDRTAAATVVATPNAQQNRWSTLKKTKLCKFHAAGLCWKGTDCQFAHGQTELMAPPNFFRTKLCMDYVRSGACRFGPGCKYAHGKEERRSLRIGSGGTVATLSEQPQVRGTTSALRQGEARQRQVTSQPEQKQASSTSVVAAQLGTPVQPPDGTLGNAEEIMQLKVVTEQILQVQAQMELFLLRAGTGQTPSPSISAQPHFALSMPEVAPCSRGNRLTARSEGTPTPGPSKGHAPAVLMPKRVSAPKSADGLCSTSASMRIQQRRQCVHQTPPHQHCQGDDKGDDVSSDNESDLCIGSDVGNLALGLPEQLPPVMGFPRCDGLYGPPPEVVEAGPWDADVNVVVKNTFLSLERAGTSSLRRAKSAHSVSWCRD